MKRIIVAMAAISLVPASQALAQANPFRPPQQGGNLSKAQVQEMVAQALAQQRAGGNGGGGPTGGTLGPQLKGNGVGSLPSQQGGRPSANVAGDGRGPAGGARDEASDPVAQLLDDGGTFVGCVSDTPIFKDKVGRRVYFTSKELRESNAARRYTRCN